LNNQYKKEIYMIDDNPKQKSNILLNAAFATISFSVAMLLLDYFRHRQFDLVGLLIGALIFFIIFYFLSRVFVRIRAKKQ